ncbi:MAG: (2Fe-2S) ferredoxin domain-containing protein, partial [Cyanobacteria bacterium J06649_4]
LSFTAPPKIFVLYDGYLTVVTEAWHLHICLEENFGGPTGRTPANLRQQRQVKRASLYRRLNQQGRAVSWGIQFWNGSDERMMTLFLPNPYIGKPKDNNKTESAIGETDQKESKADAENLLPEGKPQLEKLKLYESLRAIYVLGTEPMPFSENPLKRPYIAVCRSTRCNPSGNWQPTFEAIEQAVKSANLDIPVQTAGCLEVCKLGPIAFYSGDHTWYTRVTPTVAKQIVNSHLVDGQPLTESVYPPVETTS